MRSTGVEKASAIDRVITSSKPPMILSHVPSRSRSGHSSARGLENSNTKEKNHHRIEFPRVLSTPNLQPLLHRGNILWRHFFPFRRRVKAGTYCQSELRLIIKVYVQVAAECNIIFQNIDVKYLPKIILPREKNQTALQDY